MQRCENISCLILKQYLFLWLKGTSKNYHRHAELVSESPYLHKIAYQFRNDESQKTEFLEVPNK